MSLSRLTLQFLTGISDFPIKLNVVSTLWFEFLKLKDQPHYAELHYSLQNIYNIHLFKAKVVLPYFHLINKIYNMAQGCKK